ncbi:D(2) dopamine receptor-like [Symsagittifera roscoffensis]|uniref:D(2) dopamine receptor-like n=1 Tax=Symsagittifera roscoffensis TaxID=84072 RepID=UPI00307C4E25
MDWPAIFEHTGVVTSTSNVTSASPAVHGPGRHEHEHCSSTDKPAGELVVLWAIICFCLCGNSLSIFFFLAKRVPRNSANYIITNLALVDLLTGLALAVCDGIPGLEKPKGTGGMGKLFCVLFCSDYPAWVFITASIFNLVVIAVERYFAVVFPMLYKRLYSNKRFLIAKLAVAWLIPPFPVLFDVFFYQAEEDYCVITFNSGFVTWAGYWSLVGQLTLPTFFMFYAYIQMTVSIRAINIPPPPPLPPTDSSTSTASTTQLAGKTIWHHHSASLKFILTLTVYLRQ